MRIAVFLPTGGEIVSERGNRCISGVVAVGASLISFPAVLKASCSLGFVFSKVVTVCHDCFGFRLETYRTGVSF